jgi:alpha-N-acetylglucosamine transferase
MRDDTESCSLEADALSFGDSSCDDLFELNDTEELHAKNDANSSPIKDRQREIVHLKTD